MSMEKEFNGIVDDKPDIQNHMKLELKKGSSYLAKTLLNFLKSAIERCYL